MAAVRPGKDAGRSASAVRYQRHRPEETLLYQLVADLWPHFEAQMEQEGRPLPEFVREEFEAFLACGRLERGFLRVRCSDCHAERLLAFSCKKRGFCPSCGARRMAESAALLVDQILPELPMRQWVLSFPFALRYLFATRPDTLSQVLAIVYRVIAKRYAGAAGVAASEGHTGSVTLIQRFGSALNLNVHLPMLFLDGVYVERHGKPHFRRVTAPFKTELEVLVRQISERVGRHLERRGLLERDLESSWLTLDSADEDDGINALLGHSITYRIAVGPRAGQKAFTLQTLPPLPERPDDEPPYVAKANGFSLHAGVAAEAWERDKLERLCRYMTRPPVADKRLSLAPDGNIRYKLKTPYRNGTTHVILEPMDFMARLEALVPRPRVNLTRYHGVFAPSSSLRGLITPARRGKGGRPKPLPNADDQPARPRRSMTWAQRLRRVFNIDIETCEACGGPVKIIAAIEDPGVITRILNHLEEREAQERRAPARGPPGLFG
jgi:hypothetical protein